MEERIRDREVRSCYGDVVSWYREHAEALSALKKDVEAYLQREGVPMRVVGFSPDLRRRVLTWKLAPPPNAPQQECAYTGYDGGVLASLGASLPVVHGPDGSALRMRFEEAQRELVSPQQRVVVKRAFRKKLEQVLDERGVPLRVWVVDYKNNVLVAYLRRKDWLKEVKDESLPGYLEELVQEEVLPQRFSFKDGKRAPSAVDIPVRYETGSPPLAKKRRQ
ncbi:hypothetical protein D6783_05980 [Candidatus Woesearchaeota archaeon]|nr:MAG: hypothetical protein D6783_05980 [Candidatus Woesearchaeota archaeon]